MRTLDLDDLPPRLAQVLMSLKPGEELALVQNGLVAGRIIGGQPPVVEEPEPPPSQERAAEIFEQFRSLMEDEF